ncbi:hypothetical protein DH2020_017342 [Rehmannia glutinosa]|uniref:BHLH domain-containing protein n=1 Tax=Rehmannia glutinosa TaxID=99300 RepID=A0ABR0WTZ1_REHGL
MNLFRSSPCSLGSNGVGWLNYDPMMDMKTTRSSEDSSAGSASDGSSSVVFQNVLELPQHTTGNGSNMSIDSNIEMIDLLHDSGRSEEINYSNILQEFAPLDSFSNSFKQGNQNIPLEQQPLNSTEFGATNNCQGLFDGFPLNSASYKLLQNLFDIDSDQPQQSLPDNNQQAMNYSSQVNSNELILPTNSPMVNPSFANPLPFNNIINAPSWSNVDASTQSQFFPSSLSTKKRNLSSVRAKHDQNEKARDLSSMAKKASNTEPAFKRQRIETPSPLPTFKVRKEKLGDRVTALQQLVSPFGKTDTASVLHEAIEYIKFLHDQVSVLSTPYLKYRSPPLQHLQAGDRKKDQEGLIQDLKSRGLCLVPISSTFPVASHGTTDFWTPIFGERA